MRATALIIGDNDRSVGCDELHVDIMSAQCGPCLRHRERAQTAQFYAPIKASIKEFWLCPAIILRLFVLSIGVGHF